LSIKAFRRAILPLGKVNGICPSLTIIAPETLRKHDPVILEEKQHPLPEMMQTYFLWQPLTDLGYAIESEPQDDFS
jgi:hypothetical protein